ncbi:hypothetical protein SNE40_004678 [Patella caerulea]|uniref:Uncharacterized protein n=1 Tax=Patella caerulea TaxID=87958 RepID=A0AAN8K3H8_PATCE
MAGQSCIALFVALGLQLAAAQNWGNQGASFWPQQPWFGGQMNDYNQLMEPEANYATCMVETQGNDKLIVTFERPQQPQFNQGWNRYMVPVQEPIRMTANIVSSTIAGSLQMVITEYGPHRGVCYPDYLGGIIRGNRQDPMINQNNFWNSFMRQGQQETTQKRGGVIGNAIYINKGQSATMSERVDVAFDDLFGRGVALCSYYEQNSCRQMIQLCCTIGRDKNPASSMNNNGRPGMNGGMIGGMNGMNGGMSGGMGGSMINGGSQFGMNPNNGLPQPNTQPNGGQPAISFGL